MKTKLTKVFFFAALMCFAAAANAQDNSKQSRYESHFKTGPNGGKMSAVMNHNFEMVRAGSSISFYVSDKENKAYAGNRLTSAEVSFFTQDGQSIVLKPEYLNNKYTVAVPADKAYKYFSLVLQVDGEMVGEKYAIE